jgi:hypothetical protein
LPKKENSNSIDNGNENKELVYGLNKQTETGAPINSSILKPGESSGGAGDLDRPMPANGRLPTDEHPCHTLSQWQQRAMEGMLQALESRVNLSNGQLLSPRLQSLLMKRQSQMNTSKLSKRLEQIQLARKEETEEKKP